MGKRNDRSVLPINYMGKPDADLERAIELWKAASISGNDTVQAYIAYGEFLYQKKKKVGHGNWQRWIAQLPHSLRTARFCIQFYLDRDKIIDAKGKDDALRILRNQIEKRRLRGDLKSLRRGLIGPLKTARKNLNKLPAYSDLEIEELIFQVRAEMIEELKRLRE